MCRAWLAMALLALPLAAWPAEDVVWYDGSHSPAPAGKLLSDNAGYWGDSVLTGVTYAYERPPDNPKDTWRDKADQFGNRLLDGRTVWNWWTSVGITGPLVVTFDLKRPCRFTEVDVDGRSKRLGLKVEVADAAGGPWEAVHEVGLAEAPEAQLRRLILDRPAGGRYLRLTASSTGITWLDEVLIWGEADITPELPEAYAPIHPLPVAGEISATSLPGLDRTAFSDAIFWDWQQSLGDWAKQPAVWSVVPTWDAISSRPLLPRRADLRRERLVLMARNETECVALALTNTSWEKPWTTTVSLSPFRTASGSPAAGVTGSARVAGTIPSRNYGVNVGPLFAADNMLPPGLMQRYLTNGAGIKDFPQLTLGRGGAAVLWISVTTAHAKPGRYQATLRCAGGPPVTLTAEVLDVTLPQPRVWLQTWSGTTSQFPFRSPARDQREVAYKLSLGATVWNGFPEPDTLAAQARQPGRSFFHVWGVGDYGHKLYGGGIDPAKLTAADEQKIADLVRGHVAKAQGLGLGYDDWYVELTDEPGRGNSAAFGALARLIRKADPCVRIYCNPCFWEGNGVAQDDAVASALSPWYRDCVDISSPLYLLLRDRPRCMALFDAPHFVRGFYHVATQSAKNEAAASVEAYRKMAWEAAKRGWNGWGFYSYYAPRGNPWDDFDAEWYSGEDMPDYEMVYPGPNGPIPTRPSEAVREGWEDYCLLTLLRARHRTGDVQALVAAYEAGEALTSLRERALRLAARR